MKEVFFKKEVIPKKIDQNAENKYELMLSTLKGDFDDIDPEKRATVLDFKGIPPNLTDEVFLKWIEREMGIKKENIEANRKTQDSVETFNILNTAYKQGKFFLENTLKYKDKNISGGPESLSSKEDIIKLLNKTVLVRGKKGLSFESVSCCRLVKATIIAYETLKNDAELLKKITIGFEKKLISSQNNVESPLVLLGENKQGKQFYVSNNDKLEGSVISRGKELEKAMLRSILRPRYTAESALKDGIASRISIKEEQALELLPILCNWLTKKMGVRFLNIENKNYFSIKQMNNIEKILLANFSKNNFKLFDGKSEPTSMGNFKAFLIKGILSEDSIITSVSTHARQFEIQIVNPDNENEKGRNHHSVYDVVKFVTARTRLDGWCPENVFNEFVENASYESKIPKKDIIAYLTEDFEGRSAPIVKEKKNDNGENKDVWIYKANSVYDRWSSFGWEDFA